MKFKRRKSKKHIFLFKNLHKYTLEELKVGMRVNTQQLDNIYDTYIILSDIKLVKDDLGVCKFEGIVESITKNRVTSKSKNSTLVYNDSMDKDDSYEYYA